MGKHRSRSDFGGKIAATLLKLLGQIPLTFSSKIGRIMGHLVWAFAKTSRHVTLKNLEICFPDMTPMERKSLAKASMIETTMTAFEMAPCWVQPVDDLLKLITHADNEEVLEKALATGKGIVFIAPHFGNWELANYYMAKKCDLVVMFKPSDSPALNSLILDSRSHMSEMVQADKKGVLALFAAVKEGRATGILPDQEPSVKSGVWVPFFGTPALTPMLVSRLVNKSDAIAIGFGCQRNTDGKSFHVFYEPVENEMYDENIEVSAAAMNRCIERIILRDPAQYQWEYKRFKRRPDRAPNPYR